MSPRGPRPRAAAFATTSARSARRYLVATLIALLSLVCGAAYAREKVDTIVLFNGDRITGEITALKYGSLTIKTDYMSTVQIEWPDIVAVNSPQWFVIEDVHGNTHYGPLKTQKDRGPIVLDEASATPQYLELAEVARLSPSERSLWSRMQGSLAVGFDYAKASDISTLSSSFNTSYYGNDTVWALSAEFNSTKDPVQGTLDHHTITYEYRWLREQGRFWSGLSSLERNEETGIDARLAIGGGFGKYLVQTSRSELSTLVGLAATREWATGAADSQNSLEGILAADWRIFKFATPKTSLTATGALFPSLTESDRYRTNLSISLRQEIISDFFFDLSLYSSYDSQPPDETAEKSDYGITTSLGYSFY